MLQSVNEYFKIYALSFTVFFALVTQCRLCSDLCQLNAYFVNYQRGIEDVSFWLFARWNVYGSC